MGSHETHLQAAAGAVLDDDADVGGVNARANETSQVLILDVPHLKCVKVSVKKSVCLLRPRLIVTQPRRGLTCFSSNSTFLVSSMRFLFIYLMATIFPCKTNSFTDIFINDTQHALTFLSHNPLALFANLRFLFSFTYILSIAFATNLKVASFSKDLEIAFCCH